MAAAVATATAIIMDTIIIMMATPHTNIYGGIMTVHRIRKPIKSQQNVFNVPHKFIYVYVCINVITMFLKAQIMKYF